MTPFNKIDRPHSTSIHKEVKNKPIVEDRIYILEDNPNKTVSLMCDENEDPQYFVLDIGLGIEADDFRNYIAGKEEFFVLEDGWMKSVISNTKEMKKTILQRNTVYFLDIPEFAQTLIISAVHKGETITIRKCRGYHSAISLADWNFIIDVSKRTALLEGKTSQNEQDIVALQEKDRQLASSIASNQEDIVNNAESILGRVMVNPLHNWIPNIMETTNESGERIVENILEHFPLESSSITLTEGSETSFLSEGFKGYEGNVYTEIWTKGSGYFTLSINDQVMIPNLEQDIEPEVSLIQEENAEIISEQEENSIGYPAGGEDYQRAGNFLEKFSIPAGTLKFTITVNSGEIEVLLSDSKRLTFLQEANSGDGIKEFVFHDTTDILSLSTTTEKEFSVDLNPILSKSKSYTDQKISALGTVFDIKGIKLTYEALPDEDNEQGDVWFVGDISEPNAALDEYVWIEETGWQLLGSFNSGGGVAINDGFIGKIVPAIGTINDSSLVLANGQTLLKAEYPDYYDFCLNSPDSQIQSLIVDDSRVRVQNMSAIYLRGAGVEGAHDAGVVGTIQEDQIKNHQHNTVMGSHTHVTDIGSHQHWTDIGGHSHNVSIYVHTGGGNKGSGGYRNFNWVNQRTEWVNIGPKLSDLTNIGPKTSDPTNLGTKISTDPISGAGRETHPYSLTVNFYVQVKNYTSGRSYVIADPALGLTYKQGDMIKTDSCIYAAVIETKWTGTLNEDWQVYGVAGSVRDGSISINDTQIGMIQSYAGNINDPSWHELNGAVLLRTEYQDYYEWANENAQYLIVDADNVKVPDASDGRFLRNAGGNAGEAGTKQGDAIRNITGYVDSAQRLFFPTSQAGALYSTLSNAVEKDPIHGSGTHQNDTIQFDASRVVPTAEENRPLSMTVKYYIKILNTTKGRSDIIASPQLNMSYETGNMILLRGEIYKCAADTIWTGTLNNNWKVYGSGSGGVSINDTQIGTIQSFISDFDHPNYRKADGSIVTKELYPDYYHWVLNNMAHLIVDEFNVRLPEVFKDNIPEIIVNNNGTAYKYPDGRLVCKTRGFFSDKYSFSFPYQFINTEYYISVIDLLIAHRVDGYDYWNTRVNRTIHGFSFNGGGIDYEHMEIGGYIAEGYWKEPETIDNYSYIKVSDVGSGRQDVIASPQLNLSYEIGNMILLRGEIYKCVANTIWTGTLNDDWQVYGVAGSVRDGAISINDTQIGMIQSYAGNINDPSWHELNGAVLLRTEYQDYYEWANENAQYLIVDADSVKVPDASDGRFLRNAGGNAGEAGTKQGDAIREIEGEFSNSFDRAPLTNASPILEGVFEKGQQLSLSLYQNAPNTDLTSNTLCFRASKVVPTAEENRPLSMTVKYYIKVLNTTKGRSDIIASPQLNMSYETGNMILLRGEIYKCAADTIWTGTLNNNWQVYSSGRDITVNKDVAQLSIKITDKELAIDSLSLNSFAESKYINSIKQFVFSSRIEIKNDSRFTDDTSIRDYPLTIKFIDIKNIKQRFPMMDFNKLVNSLPCISTISAFQFTSEIFYHASAYSVVVIDPNEQDTYLRLHLGNGLILPAVAASPPPILAPYEYLLNISFMVQLD